MAIFKKNKKEETKKVSTQEDNELKDEISKAYDEIMSGNKEEKAEENTVHENTVHRAMEKVGDLIHTEKMIRAGYCLDGL